MCGLVGFVGPGTPETLARMRAVVAHRGPDDAAGWSGVVAGRRIEFGFQRLAIIDIMGGNQPMLSADERIVVMNNGEIYNFHELRRELEEAGHRFLTDHADTEVLVHGYLHWGEGMVSRLNGMFAFALLDRKEGRLLLGRDRFGKKPLYVASHAGGLVFASELRSLLCHPFVSREIDRDALARYFAYDYVPAPATLYKSIRKIEPATVLTYDLATLGTQRRSYWTYRSQPSERPPGTVKDWTAEVGRLLEKAVERRLVSDVPLGFFLSGGIDSSAVVTLAARHLGPAATSAFTIGFEESSYDETDAARRMAEQLGIRHHVEVLNFDKALLLVPDLLRRMDEPIADEAIVPNFLVARLARRHVTVALSGDGGDEMFAGYDTFAALDLARLYQNWVPAPLHRLLRRLVERVPPSPRRLALDYKLRRALRGLDLAPEFWHAAWIGPMALDEIGALLKTRMDPEMVYGPSARHWRDSASRDPVDRAIEFYVQFYLAGDILPKIDRSSMLTSLEVRSPFLDPDLAEYCARLPAAVKYRKGARKWILKEALASILPSEILDRPKQGFSVPLIDWLRAMPPPDLGFAEELGLDAGWLARAAADHAAGEADHRGLLWAWHSLEGSLKGNADAARSID